MPPDVYPVVLQSESVVRFAFSQLIVMTLLVLLTAACQQAPQIDTQLFRQTNYFTDLEQLEDTATHPGTLQKRELLLASLVVLLLVALIFLLFLQRAKQRKLIAKMEALRAQTNPHFISNSLNAIESLVNHGKNEAAAKYLIHFSRLSRRILNSTRNPQTNLKEELQTLAYFLSLEQLRFGDKLQYEFEISDGIQPDLIEVPAMIFQPYIENAILHGIKPKEGSGKVDLRIERQGKYLVCNIEDNGIGREKSKQLKASSVFKYKPYDLKIAKKRVQAIGEIKGSKIKIVDLHNTQGEVLGTRVIIWLPFKLRKDR